MLLGLYAAKAPSKLKGGTASKAIQLGTISCLSPPSSLHLLLLFVCVHHAAFLSLSSFPPQFKLRRRPSLKTFFLPIPPKMALHPPRPIFDQPAPLPIAELPKFRLQPSPPPPHFFLAPPLAAVYPRGGFFSALFSA